MNITAVNAAIIPVTPGSPEWLEARRDGIGASDAPTILGLNPFKTPRRLWAEKMGLLPEEPNDAAEIGILMEPVIAALYERRTGRELSPALMYAHRDYPWLRATPDRLAGDRVVELKNAGFWIGKYEFGVEGTDEVPASYLAQVQVQMAVTGLQLGDLAAIIGGNRFALYSIPADPELQARIIDLLGQWYEKYLLGGEQPPIEAGDNDLLQTLHPRDDGQVVMAPADMEEMLGDFQDAVRIQRRMDDRIDGFKAQVKDFLGDRAALWISEDEQITWKAPQKPTRKVDWKGVADAVAQRALAAKMGRIRKPERLMQVQAAERRAYDRIVEEYTSEELGSRRFLTPASWKKD